MAHLKLSEAFLCLDCNTIGTNSSHCVVCTSRAVHSLSAFLDRTAVNGGPMYSLVDSLMQGHSQVGEDLPMWMEPQIEDGRG